MASLLRSRSALQRASSALRARVVGVRPVPSSIVIATGVFDASAERARFPGDGCPDVGIASRAHARVSSPRVSRRGRGRLRVRAVAPRAPIARGVVSPLGFLAVWANSQDERLFLLDFFWRGDDDARVFARRRFERRPAFRPRQTRD